MPLVVVCGLPAAGKSFVATQLVDYLKLHVQEDVVYITEATVNVNRLEGYKNGHIEKMSRGALRAGVEQALNSKTIVVLDALNYIKGSRYEFYCKARAESTTYCVLYVDTPLELALERNASQEAQYDPELIKSIASRFEVPIEKNRWDSPLFHLTPEAIAKDGLMLDKIAEAVQFGKAMKAGLATQSAPVVETSFIQELEQVTTLIVDALIAHQRDDGVADALKVPKASLELRLNRSMPTSEARRHRRQFIKISQLHPCAVAAIGDLFVEYLNKQA